MAGDGGTADGPWGPHERAPAPAPDAAAAPPAAPVAPLRATDFFAAQRANRRNTWGLIFVLLSLGAGFGFLLGLTVDAYGGVPLTVETIAQSRAGMIGAAVFIGIGAVTSLVTLMAGDRVMVGLTGAHDASADDEPVLHNVVEEMAIASGLPKPRIVVIETEAMNAFAAGMRPERAVLGVTRGLLKRLDRSELQGVVGHEMGHIANMDTRYMTAVGILVGLIALVADGIRRSMFYGRVGRGGGGRGRQGGGAGALLLVVLLLFSVLAPIAAMFVRFAVSRQREYLADATSVRFTRNPQGLIAALRKLADAAEPFDGANRATQHMFIVNPFRNFGEEASALTATHPPIARRIERLMALGRD